MGGPEKKIRDSGLRYRHSLGQHFLYDEALLRELVELSGVTAEEDVLEIGPGVGTLTRPLCEAARKVLAIEVDGRVIPLLKAYMAGADNLTVLEGDVMRLNLAEATAALRAPFAVVANIPYYITTPLVSRLLAEDLPVSRLCLMVQKEVAEKMLASPGEDGWGPLAVRCRYLCEPYLARSVPAACFTPPPKVDSAFVVLPRRKEPPVKVKREKDFFRVAGAAFALRRKTMLNCLCAAFRMEREEAKAWLDRAGLDEKVRGEDLTMEALAMLADELTDREERNG